MVADVRVGGGGSLMLQRRHLWIRTDVLAREVLLAISVCKDNDEEKR